MQEIVLEVAAEEPSPRRSAATEPSRLESQASIAVVEVPRCETRLVRVLIWLSLQKPTFALLLMTQAFVRGYLRFVFELHPELARRVEQNESPFWPTAPLAFSLLGLGLGLLNLGSALATALCRAGALRRRHPGMQSGEVPRARPFDLVLDGCLLGGVALAMSLLGFEMYLAELECVNGAATDNATACDAGSRESSRTSSLGTGLVYMRAAWAYALYSSATRYVIRRTPTRTPRSGSARRLGSFSNKSPGGGNVYSVLLHVTGQPGAELLGALLAFGDIVFIFVLTQYAWEGGPSQMSDMWATKPFLLGVLVFDLVILLGVGTQEKISCICRTKVNVMPIATVLCDALVIAADVSMLVSSAERDSESPAPAELYLWIGARGARAFTCWTAWLGRFALRSRGIGVANNEVDLRVAICALLSCRGVPSDSELSSEFSSQVLRRARTLNAAGVAAEGTPASLAEPSPGQHGRLHRMLQAKQMIQRMRGVPAAAEVARPLEAGAGAAAPAAAAAAKSEKDARAPLRILCLDGGGIKGMCLVEMLKAVEARCGAPVCELFDLVCGTSTGGSLCVYINKVGPAAISLYSKDLHVFAGRVFARSSIGRLLCFGQKVPQALLTGSGGWSDHVRAGLVGAAPPQRPAARPWRRLFATGQEDDAATTLQVAWCYVRRRRKRAAQIVKSPFRKSQAAAPAPQDSQLDRPTEAVAHARRKSSIINVDGAAGRDGSMQRLAQSKQHVKADAHRVPHTFCVISRGEGKGRGVQWEAFLARNYAHPESDAKDCAKGAGDWSYVETLLATTAAPTFFGPLVKDGVTYVDGGLAAGLAANNPSMHALHEAQYLWPGRPIGVVASLGCGKVINKPSASNGSLLYWAGQLMDLATTSAKTHADMKTMVGLLKPRPLYVRLEPPTGDVKLDESRPGKLRHMVQRARSYVLEKEGKFDRLCLALLMYDTPAAAKDAAARGTAERLLARNADGRDVKEELARLRRERRDGKFACHRH